MLRLVFFLFFAFNANAESVSCLQQHCVGVVDVGSTGSRIHIYAYDLDKNKTPIKINEVWSNKIKPGFATIDASQSAVNTYLNNLFANNPLPNIPVYFYATAGMRLHSQTKQQQYHQAVELWFKQHPQFKLAEAQTITGDKEGLYGWLAANYQLGTLTDKDKPLVGVMDMGGASVQIVFPVKDKASVAASKDLTEVTIYGRHISLFAHSFLGLGQNVLSQQFLDTESCFADGYKLPDGSKAEGNALTCQTEVSKLVNTVHGASTTVQPAIAANPVHTWYAIGGITSLVAGQPFHFDNHQFTNQALLNQAESEICQKQWPQLQTLIPANEYLYGYCLYSSYYYALIVNGYGINPDQPINYFPNNDHTDWTLGVVLLRKE